MKWTELSGRLLLIFFRWVCCFSLLQVTFSSLGVPGIHNQLWGLYGRIVLLFEAIVFPMRYTKSFRSQIRVVGSTCASTILTLIMRLFLLLVVLFFRLSIF